MAKPADAVLNLDERHQLIKVITEKGLSVVSQQLGIHEITLCRAIVAPVHRLTVATIRAKLVIL